RGNGRGDVPRHSQGSVVGGAGWRTRSNLPGRSSSIRARGAAASRGENLAGDFWAVKGPTLLGRDDANFVNSTARNVDAAVGCGGHVTNNSSTGRNDGARELLRLGIELHDGVGLHTGFAVPHHAIRRDGNAV